MNAALDSFGEGVLALVRPAAQAGAQILYDEMLARVPVAEKPHKLKGGRVIPPGALKASIYQVYSQDHSRKGVATYHITWNRKKAPHGHLVEFGTSRAPAHPFQRPAFDAKHIEAVEATKVKMEEGMTALLAGRSA